ncbi:MAG: hypothetical protein GY861_28405, partial [bacterium]|nr:hypothetical protein [bacterium]
MKHILQTFADLEPECQAGVYCPDCAELCPLTVDTVIHHCENCSESYCLLCAHENGYCLTCEADLEVSSNSDSSLPVAKTVKTKGLLIDENSKSCSSFQSLSAVSEDAVTPCPDQTNQPLSANNLTSLLQLYTRMKNFERVIKATNALIHDIRLGTERELRKQHNEPSTLFNVAQMFEARLDQLEAASPLKGPLILSMDDLD